MNYEKYELLKVKEDMGYVGEFVTELRTLLELFEKGLLPSGLNELQIKYQLRDVKRAMVNSWLILELNEHGDNYWTLSDKRDV